MAKHNNFKLKCIRSSGGAFMFNELYDAAEVEGDELNPRVITVKGIDGMHYHLNDQLKYNSFGERFSFARVE